MFAADMVRFVAVSILAVRQDMPAVGIALTVALLGLGQGLFQPPYAALSPRIVSPDLLQPANGLNSMAQYGAQIGGPAIGGVLLGFFGARTVLAVDAASYVLSLVSLLGIREAVTGRSDDRRESGLRGAATRALADFRGGFQAVRERPWIASTIAMITISMTVGIAPALVLAPVEAHARFGGQKAYSMILAAIGVGAVVGALGASRVRTRRPGILATAARVLNAGAILGLAFFALAGVIVTWALAGAGVAFAAVLYQTAIQKDLPDNVLARVMALNWLGSSGLMPLGYAMTGVLVGVISPRALLLCVGLLVLVITPLPLMARGGTTMSSAPGSPTPAIDPGKE
jgi:predicted MFS family arabinose efflux permease